MPKFSVEQPTKMTADKCFDKVKGFITSADNNIRRFDPKMTVEFEDSKKICLFKGGQFNFSGTIEVVAQQEGSKATIVIDLPLMLTPFKAKIESMLREELGKLVS